MARTNSIAQNRIDPTRPFYAAVGSVDAAVHLARTSIGEAQARLAKVDFEPKALADSVQKEALAIPSRVSSRVEAKVNEYVADLSGTVEDLNQQYVDLAARGRTLVNKIRGQQATQDLTAEVKKTTARAKTTRTQATKTAEKVVDSAEKTARTATDSAKKTARSTGRSAKTVRSSAKATGTSARKTATAARKATADAAAKTGA